MTEQYSSHASDWSDSAYADSDTYLRRRAELVEELGTRLDAGDVVCDLACGDGVARIAYPDSVRLDFFLGGGHGGGAAVLIGDSLVVPGPDLVRRLVPPRALLWAALGRLDFPSERDTLVRVDGPMVRADIGSPIRWRATFNGDSLSRLERVDGGRIQEWVQRGSGQRVQYRHESSGRTLSLVIQRSDAASAFNPSIWKL